MFDLDQIDELLSTTRAVRRQLDLERPVERSLVTDCLRLAMYAPNATNAQDWRWLVVTHPDTRQAIGDLYRRVLEPISLELREQRRVAGDTAGLRHSDSVLHLIRHLGDVPVHVIPCLRASVGPSTSLAELTGIFGSIYPAVWSFQLALRSRGLASVFTTGHLLEADRSAAILGVPDDYIQTCLIPVAHSLQPTFSAPPRRPVDEVVMWEHWEA